MTIEERGSTTTKMAADSGMETCPSPEIADSRKRPLDGDAENGDTKRSHFSSGEWEFECIVFFLFPHAYDVDATVSRSMSNGT